ncbi:MAG: glycosyltransferase family 2 protein [Actinomycetia bacterium]|nr:glycosyltransferase family 2 protein [Actinomycetes bacterium]
MAGNPSGGKAPDVSVVVPTLNSEKTLPRCLESVTRQEYGGAIEIIVADGGSTDGTVSIARGYGCIIVENPLKTGEAGKACGIRKATGEIVALIDSDNLLCGDDWLKRMTAPFRDSGIAGSEPIEYTFRRSDAPLTRYCALMGMNDPLCYFLGNYDRVNTITGRWTGLEIATRDQGDYLDVYLETGALPTMGANGFLVRRDLLEEMEIGDYLFDIDLLYNLVKAGHQRFAKVKIGIVHLYGRGLGTFARKQLRRVRDFQYYRARGMRTYPWSRQKKWALARFMIYCLLVVPLLAQSFMGYRKKPDSAWALHAPACVITLLVYSRGFIEGAIRPREQKRTGWSQ